MLDLGLEQSDLPSLEGNWIFWKVNQEPPDTVPTPMDYFFGSIRSNSNIGTMRQARYSTEV